MSDEVWKGELRKGSDPGTVVGTLTDRFGWTVSLHGTLQPGGGYSLTATLGDPPESLRVTAIDGEAK